MKVKVISRSETEYTKETASDLQRVHRNLAPELHPFERAREFKTALNAVKLDRMFAKPFIGQLEGHSDSISAMARSWVALPIFMSGSSDGELRVWNLTTRKCLWRIQAHQSFVTGLTVAPDGETFYSASSDRTVKMWRIDLSGTVLSLDAPAMTYAGKYTFTGIDYHRERPLFVTGSRQLDVWDPTRAEPVHSFAWGEDSINCVKFSPVETDIIAATATDRSITIYDIRAQSAVRKVVLRNASTGLCFNPMEAMNFTVGNEDHNAYTFDLRMLDRARCVHSDHVGAVIDVDYSPTGQEFVTAGYDCTLRIFDEGAGRSRDMYHTKRMQRVLTVRYSLDSKYVLSGSDDTSIRIWKSEASRERGVQRPRQEAMRKYRERLAARFEAVPVIRKIAKGRHAPKAIYSARKLKHVMLAAQLRKEERRRAHSVPKPYVPARQQAIVEERE